jgi:hypothetical protein
MLQVTVVGLDRWAFTVGTEDGGKLKHTSVPGWAPTLVSAGVASDAAVANGTLMAITKVLLEQTQSQRGEVRSQCQCAPGPLALLRPV